MLLGFLLTALYWPGIAGAATTPRWGLLAVVLPLVLLYYSVFRGIDKAGSSPVLVSKEYQRQPTHGVMAEGKIASILLSNEAGPRFTLVHLFGALFILWSATSLLWTPNRLDGAGELVKLVILAMAFVYGSHAKQLDSLLKGMAVGLLPSCVLLLIEPWYPDLVLHTTTHSGLFINSGSLAEISALVLIGLIYYRVWWLALGLLPCILLPASRGAWLALVAAFTVCLWGRSKLSALALMALTGICITYSFYTGFHISSVMQRLGMWGDAIGGLSWLGHGLGSFWTDYAPLSNTLDIFVERPEHLHNDWLEILFELGPIGGLFLGALYLSLARSASVAALVLAGFFAESAVGFTLHVPCTAFLAALCLGHLARDGVDLRDALYAGRVRFRRRLEREGATHSGYGAAAERATVSAG